MDKYIIIKNKQHKPIIDLPPDVCLGSLLLPIPMSVLVEDLFKTMKKDIIVIKVLKLSPPVIKVLKPQQF